MRRLLVACTIAVAAVDAAPALAHRLAPSYLELVERADGRVEALWKTPRVVSGGAAPRPVLPGICRETGARERRVDDSAWIERFALDCGGDLVGLGFGVEGLRESGTDALVRVALADGREVRAILTADAPRLVVPERESARRVLADYASLGFEHLVTGPDHLLFVLGLLWLLPRRRKLLAAVSSFTAGHSLTLALAALGVVGLPPVVVEIAIAATLVALAVEASRPDTARSLLVRHPGLAPFGFGLVHGLGFAGALAAIGLPGHAIPLALFSFNVGIELAQLALVGLAFAPVRALWRARDHLPRALAELPATAIGSLGVFYAMDRTASWLAGA